MLEQNVLAWIGPEECTSRFQEVQSIEIQKVALHANGNINFGQSLATFCNRNLLWASVISHEGFALLAVACPV